MSVGSVTLPKLNKPPVYRWWVLIMGAMVELYFYMACQLIAAYAASVMQTYEINNTQLGLLVTAAYLGYALAGYFGGALTDTLGNRKVVSVGYVAVAVFTLIWPLVDSYPGMMIVRFLQGLGGGLMIGSVIPTVNLWFPARERALAQAILVGGLGVGFSIVSAGGVALSAVGIEWRVGSLLMVGIPGLILAALWFFTIKDFGSVYPGSTSIDELLPEEYSRNAATADNANVNKLPVPDKWSDALRNGRFWSGAICAFANCWIAFGMGTVFPLFLSTDMNMTAPEVAKALAVIFPASLVCCPLGGLFSDKVLKARRSPNIVIGYAIVIISVMLVRYAPAAIIPALLFLAFGGVPFQNGSFWASSGEVVAPNLANKTGGFWLFIGIMGGVVANPLCGYLIDATGSAMGAMYTFLIMGIVGLITGALLRN